MNRMFKILLLRISVILIRIGESNLLDISIRVLVIDISIRVLVMTEDISKYIGVRLVWVGGWICKVGLG